MINSFDLFPKMKAFEEVQYIQEPWLSKINEEKQDNRSKMSKKWAETIQKMEEQRQDLLQQLKETNKNQQQSSNHITVQQIANHMQQLQAQQAQYALAVKQQVAEVVQFNQQTDQPSEQDNVRLKKIQELQIHMEQIQEKLEKIQLQLTHSKTELDSFFEICQLQIQEINLDQQYGPTIKQYFSNSGKTFPSEHISLDEVETVIAILQQFFKDKHDNSQMQNVQEQSKALNQTLSAWELTLTQLREAYASIAQESATLQKQMSEIANELSTI
jgi:hypothetical protein